MPETHHRKYPRVEADITVEYNMDTGPGRARASWLGGGGMFLGVGQQLSPGTEMTLRFRPAKHLPVMSVRAIVRYEVAGQGVGIEFSEIDPQHREMILRLIHHRMLEQRHYPRAPLAAQVEDPAGTQIGFSKDLSAGGMFIEVTKSVPIGSRISLIFHLDDGGEAVKVEGEVLYSVVKLGIGVRFLNLAPEYERRIEAYVAKAAA